jgi:hypothetical protein
MVASAGPGSVMATCKVCAEQFSAGSVEARAAPGEDGSAHSAVRETATAASFVNRCRDRRLAGGIFWRIADVLSW